MSSILVVFGTTDGHTARIAAFVAAILRGAGAQVDLVRAGVGGKNPSPAFYDAVVVAGSVHSGGYQRALRGWVRRHADGMRDKPTAMISVCLGILQKDPNAWADLDTIVDRFVRQTGWLPSVVKIVAGALPYTRYSWLKRFIMRRIVRKAGVETDPTRDYEYTDWEDLRLFAAGFLRRVSGEKPARAAACCVSGGARPLVAAI